MTAPLSKGIQATPFGYRAYVRVKGFPLRTKRFKAGTDLDRIKAWRELARAKMIVQRTEKTALQPPSGTFRADVPTYLAAVKAMPSYADRVRDMAAWLAFFPHDQRSDQIDALQIRTARDQWLTVGPRSVQRQRQRLTIAAPLAPSTVNHRLRALSNFFTVMWPKADNPARSVEEAAEQLNVPRGLPYPLIRKVLAAFSDQGHTRAKTREDYSAAKIRAAILAWTGIMPIELERLTPTDNQWRQGVIVITARRKGGGAPGRLVPLVAEARAALKTFDKKQLYGPFDRGVLNKALARACDRVGVPRFTCYTFRHSFVTGIVRATKNLDQGGLLAGHRDPRTTLRYAMAAHLPMLQHGVKAFGHQTRRR